MLKRRPLIRNTLILTAVALLLRGLGLAFQSYVTGVIGAAGTGLFSLAMSVSALGVTVATSGLRYAVTRLVAAQFTLDRRTLSATMHRAFVYAAFCSGIAFCGLYFGADAIALNWVKDVRVADAIRILAFALPFVAMCGAISGYFTAIGKIGKVAVPQIADQLTLFAAVLFLLPRTKGNIEQACSAIVLSNVFANIVNFAISAILYAIDKNHKQSTIRKQGLSAKLLKLAVPIAVSAYVRTGLSTLQHMLVPAGLRSSGLGAEGALAAHGVIHGMVFPVLLFPSVLMVSLSELIIPSLTEAQVSGNHAKVRRIVSRILQMSFYFAFACAMIMLLFGGQIGKILFKSAEAGHYIRMLAPLVLVMYMDMITDGMLKGLGEQLYTMYVNIADSTVSVILVWLTLPIWGIKAYLFMIIFTELFNFLLSIRRLRRVLSDSRGGSKAHLLGLVK